jgi:hypothetical protein
LGFAREFMATFLLDLCKLYMAIGWQFWIRNFIAFGSWGFRVFANWNSPLTQSTHFDVLFLKSNQFSSTTCFEFSHPSVFQLNESISPHYSFLLTWRPFGVFIFGLSCLFLAILILFLQLDIHTPEDDQFGFVASWDATNSVIHLECSLQIFDSVLFHWLLAQWTQVVKKLWRRTPVTVAVTIVLNQL